MKKLKAHSAYLTALLLLTSCTGLKPFPTKFIYEVDLKNGVCGQYKIVDPEKLKFDHVADLPLSNCNGVFGFASDKVGLVFNWAETAIQKCKGQCQ